MTPVEGQRCRNNKLEFARPKLLVTTRQVSGCSELFFQNAAAKGAEKASFREPSSKTGLLESPSCPLPFSGKKKQHKHKLIGPDFPRTFLTLTPGCPGLKKFLPTTGAAGKPTFWCGRPRFSARTSMTRRVVEKLCTKKVCVDFLAPNIVSLREFLKALETTTAMKRLKISCSCGSDC